MKSCLLFLIGIIAVALLGISTVSATNINTCQDLSADISYTLTANVQSDATCFNITGSNLILDCQGYKIVYSDVAEGYGINDSLGYDNITIKNCLINQSLTAVASSYAIITNGTNSNFINNTIKTIGGYGYGFYLLGSNQTIQNTKIYTYGNNAWGMRIDIGRNNSIINSSIIVVTASARGISFGGNGTANLLKDSLISGPVGIERDIVFGSTGGGIYNITNCTFNSGQVEFEGTTTSKLNVHWYSDVYANYTNADAVSGATVRAYNVNGSLVFIQTTGSNGMIPRQTLLEYMQNATRKYFFTNYTMNATKTGFTDSETKSINFTNNIIDVNKTTLNFVIYIINNVTYTSPAIETQSSTFILNLTSNATSITMANFTYNKITYAIAPSDIVQIGTDWIITKIITLPLGSGNKGFNFNFTMTLSGSQFSGSTVNYTQTVGPISFDVSCATGLPVLNYTFLEESNRTTINGTANVNMLIWNLGASKDVFTNYSFSTTTANSFQICANGNYSADVYITSTSAFQGKSYVQKTYYLLNALLNTSAPQYDFLHQLPTSSSTSIILHVLDQGYSPLADHYVKIQRYYISENAWRTVEVAKTDDNGYSITHLVEEDVDYNFIVQDYTTALETTGSRRITCLDTPCILEIRVSEESNPYQYLMPDGLSYNFYYINDTKTVYLDWNDANGESVVMRLVVIAKTTRDDIVVCNSSLQSDAGILTCDLSGRTEENFYARVFRGASAEQLLNNLWVSLATTYLKFGNEGVIFSFLLMLTMTLIGIWNPSVGLILLGGTFIVMMLFNFIYMTPMIIGAVAVIIILGVRYLRT